MPLPIKFAPNDLPDILDFVLNEESNWKKPPDNLKGHPYLRVTGLLNFAKGYDFDKDLSLIILAGNLTGLADRVNAVETITKLGGTLDARITAVEMGIVKRPPEATQKQKDEANTTLANKHRR